MSTRLMMGSKRIDPKAGTANPMMTLSYWDRGPSARCCWPSSLAKAPEEAAA